jgi:SAM-dependent methyltransferase
VDLPVPLVCPRDGRALELGSGELACGAGHRYPLPDGIPVLLLENEPPTHGACWISLEEAEAMRDSVTGSDAATSMAAKVAEGDPEAPRAQTIDPLVQAVVAATCGGLYRHLVGRLETYPIPELPLPEGNGELFLEVGCNWGRWCVAAAQRGYRVVGVDPSLSAIAAARRVAHRLGIDATYLVADARHLPFPAESFDVVFSYSVFQHFAKTDALASFDEIGRVLRPGGLAKLQMANVYGARSLWRQLRERRFREPRRLFDVRYWSPGELRRDLSRRVGPTELEVDGFFTLNAQTADLGLLPRRFRLLVRISDALRRASRRIPQLRYSADSLYAVARRPRPE